MAKKNGHAKAQEDGGEFLDIPLTAIDEAPENVRRTSWGDIEELAESMRAHGQITPGVVRPAAAGRYELIIGARRLRAARLAPCNGFRAEVVIVDDATAHAMRMVENNQREGVTPLEEAEAFDVAIRRHGQSVDDIAAHIGRSKAYVYQRMRLLDLVPEGRKLLESDRLAMTSAFLIAQLSDAQQAAVVQEITTGWLALKGNEPIPSSRVSRAIEGMTRALEQAPFDPLDATLSEQAGSCGTCPKRSGTQGLLFRIFDRKDVCLDTACFEAKRDAAWERKRAAARDAGLVVLEGEEAKEATSWDAPFRELDDVAFYIRTDGTRTEDDEEFEEEEDAEGAGASRAVTWREVVGPDVKPTLVRDDRGKVHELVPQDIAAQALASVDPARGKAMQAELAQTSKVVAKNESDAQRFADEAKRAKAKAEIEAEGKRRAMAALVASVEQPDDDPSERAALLRTFVIAMMSGTWADTLVAVCKRRGWKLEDAQSGTKLPGDEVIAREMTDMTTAQVTGLAVEIVATRSAGPYALRPGGSGFDALLDVRNINLKHHLREAEKAAKEKHREKRERSKKKGRTKESADAVAE
jgi:ParB/RepB/Spo0J family partition protein